MNKSQELHVIFGTGPVGLTLAEELLARGKQVRLVNRSGKGAVPAGAELIAGDVSNPTVARELSQGAAVIYNATHAPYERWPEILPRLQENMIESAAIHGARLVVIDTLYLYGETHGQPMTEETPHTATSRKGRLRAELAWGYLQAHRVGKARVTIGRAADFFGPRVLNSSLGQYVFPAALSKQPVLVLGNSDLPHSYSYMPDIARSLATLGERDEAFGKEWLLPVAPVVSTRTIIQLIEQELGYQLQLFPIPSIEYGQEQGIFDQTFIEEYRELFYQHTEPQIVDSSAIERAFGLRATPLKEALAATIRWYQEQAK
ncbi:nucleoside-diphosphate-sugar epimerase [Thermosporothrix hazakensis]|uniref:Nucleoside-diphosphate-sugar epimerase n=2 Tax=Thermosporothrix TaxID=768650 RepID=A0A326UDP8_THEHA|nr:NAD-dependent epimerase/dehydratase family protein [Thermosporothrix hazakensis]PZW24105.1 nucleoside-diphosphate-sugar epimerase [Thermosporothrix hazakensis]BBH87893.1 epimerase [Thermosporothrix sp. COM3]GCE50317.1 epimerase [Thermosporothrix hazakensis]